VDGRGWRARGAVDVESDDIQDEVGLAEAVIRFDAIVAKAQTLADGGIRISLDLPESAIPQMAMLIEAKREGVPLEFVAKVKT